MFSDRLKAIRSEKQVTQSELADLSGLGLQTIRGYEQGVRQPTWENVVKLAEALGVSTEAFRERDGE